MMVEKFEFAGTEYIVIDKFEYQGTEYMYVFEDISKKIKGKDINSLQENINAKADFVFKCEDGMFENVVDDELYKKLISLENKRNMTGKNEILERYFGNIEA